MYYQVVKLIPADRKDKTQRNAMNEPDVHI
jgi:hypothetical protein